MNVLHLNTLMNGGAASGAYRLHLALKSIGINSKMIVQKKTNCDDDDVIEVPKTKLGYLEERVESMILSTLRVNHNEGQYFYLPQMLLQNNNNNIIDAIPFKPDLLIVHWTTVFANVKTFYQISKRFDIPVIWYMTDMEPMTGGCHYSFDCDGLFNSCSECPALKFPLKFFAKYWLKQKKEYIAKTNMQIVASSSYMLDKANNATVFEGKRKHLVLRGIDDKIFSPVSSRNDIRKKWGVDEDKLVIFFGAQSLTEPRKGMKVLLQALKCLYTKLEKDVQLRDSVQVVFAGRDCFKEDDILFKSKFVGFMKTQQDLASMYQLADVFVCPTLQDSGPMMASESLMCGTPVAGFKMGVLPDVVIDGETGFLADVGDAEGLAKALEKIVTLSEPDRGQMRKNCREFAEKHLTYNKQAEGILRVYESFGR